MIKWQLAIFLVVGSLTVLIDFVTYRGLVLVGLLNVNWSKGMGFVMGTVFSYFVNRFWTFSNKQQLAGSAWRFAMVYTATLAVNIVLNGLALNLLGELSMAVQLAFLMASGLSATLNFLGMKYFVFKSAAHDYALVKMLDSKGGSGDAESI
jgi:putative flippase GtrA